jgi:PASTA domain
MRRTLVGLVLALAVLGAGCSSQPSAVAVAQQKVRALEATVRADSKAELTDCRPPTDRAGVVGTVCSAPSRVMFVKIFSDESRLIKAELVLDRAEGDPTTTTLPGGNEQFVLPCTACRTVVPNVVGESVPAAEGQLEQLDLLVAVSASQQVGGPSGQTFGNKVAQQEPAPGTKVARRSTVTITQNCVSGCGGT